MGKLHSQWTVVGLLAAFGVATACSSTEDWRNHSAQTAAVVPPGDLRAKIVGVTTTGELCPQGRGEIEISDAGDLVNWTASPEDPALPPQSSTPSCSITLEVDVPAGFQMGAPTATWRGFAAGEPDSTGSATRTYSFENGDTRGTTPTGNLTRGFNITDNAVPIFSPTCAGQQRARMTATFVAEVFDPTTPFILEMVQFRLGWRQGTQYKDGCSPGELVGADAAQADDWCGGPHSRACAAGLECEFDQGRRSLDEGTCVDPNSSAPDAKANEPCGGPRNIQCEAGAVCWHATQQEIAQGLLGRCFTQLAGDRAPCHTGVPSLECDPAWRSPDGRVFELHCSEYNHICQKHEGKTLDPCGEPGMPECPRGYFCSAAGQNAEMIDTGAGFCWPATGRTGEPCGFGGYADCQSPRTCENNRCEDPRGGINEPCEPAGCVKGLVCLDATCVRP